MKTVISIISVFGFLVVSLHGQGTMSKKAQDLHAIKKMEGCFEVDFKYTETFSPEVDYEKAYDYFSSAHELAFIVEATEDRVQIQHLLIINDSTVIKHWRQDWVYEADQAFDYVSQQTWSFYPLTKEESQGKWTQLVYQVDDSPRYSGTATWTHVDGRSSWFDVAPSPLPRREYSKRSDYNIMMRGNRVVVDETGWLHEQDNKKVIRENGEDRLLVEEKGYNTYTRKADGDCQLAADWWEKNKSIWSVVRKKWDEEYSRRDVLVLKDKLNDKRLYEHLFYYKGELLPQDISDLIDMYIEVEQ